MAEEKQISISTKTKSDSLLKQGNISLRQQDFQRAKELFEKALIETPELKTTIEFNIELARRSLESNHSKDRKCSLNTLPVTSIIPTKKVSLYEGRIENVGNNIIKGWAVNKDNAADIFDLNIKVDGAFFCSIKNDHSRADLQRAGKSNGRGGYSISIPMDLLDSEKHYIEITFPNGETLASTELEGEKKREIDDIYLLPTEEPVSIIVPIYNAADDVKSCIERLVKYTPKEVDVILINDASSDPQINSLLENASQYSNFRIYHNRENLGFTKTVNRGISIADKNDVILLNSDARVTPRWIEGFRRALATDHKIATVTAMSDRAGAFSAPNIGNENDLPIGISEADYAVAFRRRAVGYYPTVPTGNGFCMYIRRKCIEEIGGLDSEAFPRGYGEENDFCMRARANGWRNVMDDRTYIFHDRSKSFGGQKDDLIKAGRAVIDARYPDYKKAIAIFKNSPLINLARFKARLAVADCKEKLLPRGLFVISTLTGGTPQTNQDLMLALADKVEGWLLHCNANILSLYRTHKDRPDQLIRRHILNEPVEVLTHYCAEYDRVVSNWLAQYDFEFVHIRHLAWHSLSLPKIAKRAGARVIHSFHDFYTICPTVKLLDDKNNYCNGVCSKSTEDCQPDLWEKGSLPQLKNSWIKIWREKFNSALRHCDVFITTHESVRKTIIDNLDIDGERFHVISHARNFDNLCQLAEPFKNGEPLKILVPGNISTPKGSKIIEQLLEIDEEQKLHFHILGKSNIKFSHPRLIFHGEYKREEFFKHVQDIRPHIGAVFSIWNETWCHTLTELWSCGIPALVTQYPTLADRVEKCGGGWVVNHESIESMYEYITKELCQEDSIKKSTALVLAHQKNTLSIYQNKEMADKYLSFYVNN